MAKRGAKPKILDPTRRERLLAAIRAGNYLSTAAAYAGIGESTFHRYMEFGRTEPHGHYHDLYEDVQLAQLDCEAKSVIMWRSHFQTDYRAIRDFLERRFPRRWGRSEKVVHAGTVELTGPPADSALAKIVGNPTALEKYNDFLVALSEAARPKSSGSSDPS